MSTLRAAAGAWEAFCRDAQYLSAGQVLIVALVPAGAVALATIAIWPARFWS